MQSLAAADPPWIGTYRLLARLGSGGMGHVYFARSPGGRTTALKVVRPELAGDPTFRARFRREVESARRVSGVFTAPVLDADAEGPIPWLAVAYVPGPSLHEAVAEHGTMDEAGLRSLGAGLAEALVAIHRVGLIHRDLKPGNVLLAADGPKVIDFGISRAADGTVLTATGALVGSPGFMSPEQVVGDASIDLASDVFSLAATLIYAATGTGPFDGGPTSAVLYRIVREAPRLDGLPASLAPIMVACLDKDPTRRPTPQALVDALSSGDPVAWLSPSLQAEIAGRARQAAALGAVPDPPPVSVVQPNQPRTQSMGGPSRRRLLGLAAAIGGISAVGGATAWALDRAPTRSEPHSRPSGPPVLPLPKRAAPLWTFSTGDEDHIGDINIPMTIVGDTLCVAGSDLHGLDRATGAVKWTRPGDKTYYDPMYLGLSSTGTELYGIANDKDVFGCEVATGRSWTSNPVDFDYMNGNAIGVIGASGNNVCIMHYAPDHGFVFCVDFSSGRILWRSPASDNVNAAVVGPDACYMFAKDAIFASDLATGQERWRWHDQTIMPSYENICYVDGLILSVVSTESMETNGLLNVQAVQLTALNSTSGVEVWRSDVSGSSGALAVGGGLVLTLFSDSVVAFDISTGKLRWRTPTSMPLDTSNNAQLIYDRQALSASDSVAVAGYLNGAQGSGFVVMNLADGKIRWDYRVAADTEAVWQVLADGDQIYAIPIGVEGAEVVSKLYAFSA